MRVRLLNRWLTSLYDDALRPHGLTVAQMNVLVAIEAFGGLPAGELADRLHMEKSTLSRSLARMREHGWIAVASSGAVRREIVELSDLGRALIEDAAPAWREAQSEVVEILGDRDARALHRVGERVWNLESRR